MLKEKRSGGVESTTRSGRIVGLATRHRRSSARNAIEVYMVRVATRPVKTPRGKEAVRTAIRMDQKTGSPSRPATSGILWQWLATRWQDGLGNPTHVPR